MKLFGGWNNTKCSSNSGNSYYKQVAATENDEEEFTVNDEYDDNDDMIESDDDENDDKCSSQCQTNNNVDSSYIGTTSRSVAGRSKKTLLIVFAAILAAIIIAMGFYVGNRNERSFSFHRSQDSHSDSSNDSVPRPPIDSNTTGKKQSHKENLKHFRRMFNQISDSLRHQQPTLQTFVQTDGTTVSLEMINLSEFYQIVSSAIDQMGVVGLYFDVFADGTLKWFDSGVNPNCKETHGTIGCGPEEPWWFYHYIGAMTIQKLLREGSLRWDPTDDGSDDNDNHSSVRSIINDATTLFRKLHVEMDQRLTTAGDMSYHAQHGLLWELLPQQHDFFHSSYPFELADAYCGDYYGHNKVRGTQAHRTIGYECFHGIGHATFFALARRQLQIDTQTNDDDGDSPSSTSYFVMKPSTGFAFTRESWCAVQRVCSAASNMTVDTGYSTDVSDRCFGGVRHSVRIFARDDEVIWRYDTDKDDQLEYFYDQMDDCDDV
ncbi:hypothetical protein IV203_033625 [Nitzschia inconspicua]|uniref:Uncharacterized protein n=1 Tax=Nitzschia inconspicua TaxID=303405 RepID=A0A9K3M6A7_9STRA|nr:hypothetical protein IV203_033625 [Nitzschia inconspicua]